MMKALLFFTAGLLFSTATFSQEYFFKNYTIREGLRSNYIIDINQSSDGLIVASSYGGVSVLYPIGIKTYRSEITNDYPSHVFSLKKNKVLINWVYGYSIINLTTGESEYFRSLKKGGLHIFAADDGSLFSFEKNDKIENLHYINDSLISHSQVTDVHIQSHKLFLSTLNNGIILYDANTRISTTVALKGKPVYSLKGVKEKLYAVTSEGIFLIREEDHLLTELEMNYEQLSDYEGLILDFELDQHGNQWLTGHFTGVFLISDGKFRELNARQGFTSSKVHSMFQDREGNMWFGTIGQGLFMYRNDPFTLTSQTSSDLTVNNIGAIEKHDAHTIIGYAPGGIEILSESDGSKSYYSFYNSELTDDNILLLEKYEDRVFGIAINQLFQIHEGIIQNIPKPDTLNFLRGRNIDFGNGMLYISSPMGILTYDIKMGGYLRLLYGTGKDDEVLHVDYYDQKLFFTTRKGLFKWVASAVKQLYEDSIHYTYTFEHNEALILISGDGHYLFLDRKEEVVRKGRLSGITTPVQAVVRGGRKIYVFTDGTCHIFERDIFFKEQEVIKAEYVYTHGFDIFPNSAKLIENEILLGSSEGIIHWKQHTSTPDTIAPSLLIRHPAGFIRKEGNIIVVPKEIRDDPIQLYAIDYKSGHNVQLTIRKASDLNSSTSNFLELQGNFSPGTNPITISATDPDGNRIVATAVFEAEKFWYETILFKALLITTLLVVLILLYTYSLNRRERKLLRKEDEKRQIEEKLRESIAMDFHDELGNNLAVLNVQVEKLRLQINGNPVFIPVIDEIRTSYKKIFENSKDLVWALNPSSDNLHEVMIRGKDFGERLFRDTPIKFRCVNNIHPEEPVKIKSSAAKDMMYIIKESFTNAYRHAEASEVELNISSFGGKHVIEIKDNGKGISTDHKPGRGLRYIKKRAARINYTIEVITSEKGTTVKLEGHKL